MAQTGERQAEIAQKRIWLREWIASHELDAVHLHTIPNTSWLTGGASLDQAELSAMAR